MKKTTWAKLPTLLTRAYFNAKAQVYRVFFGDLRLDVKPKVFSTGGLGWHLQTKKQLPVGDALVWCQINIQVSVIGSKALPPDDNPVPEVTDAETAA